MNKDVNIFLSHILESIEAIEEYTKDLDSESAFIQDKETQDSVIRRLEIIGEAIRKLPEETKQQASEVSWKEIMAMRNILIHEYFGVDLPLVWQVVHKDLPALKKDTKSLLDKLSN